MPEGPSIVIIKEELQSFKGKKILQVEGNAKIELALMENKKIKDFKSWGKHFLICFDTFYLRIHLLMFGTYRINERKEADPRLLLKFKNSEFSFYTCSIKLIKGNPAESYDWDADIMSETWSHKKAVKKINSFANEQVCDVLLNQDIFAGVGNIIKNEVLFRTRIHPESVIGNLPRTRLNALVKDARDYSLQFYIWKKAFVLKKNWVIYKKLNCLKCKSKVTRAYCGKTKRLTCYCENCQKIY
ncbi:MAG: endonuclease [Bacteroidota bacterium]|jgi:endonuclease-8|nr:endonuclease [Bacteroidota bacterium]